MQLDMFGGAPEVQAPPPAPLERCPRTLDMFDAAPPPAAAPQKAKKAAEPEPDHSAARAEHAAAIAAIPEKLRPSCAPVPPMPDAKAKGQLDAWTRETQRLYLLYLVGAIARGIYRDSSTANVRFVLLKLNGLAGEW
jgi:hypothetical protein